MSFAPILDNLPLEKSPLLREFERRIAPATDAQLEAMAKQARALTQQNFGRTMRLFAPLYLSNECINNCRYCGFSRDNPILRVTLDIEEVATEARHLAAQGFRQVLLVAGEHPKFVSGDYLSDCVRALAAEFSSIAIEVGPMETAEYEPVVAAGAEALVVYQETYDRQTYAEMHTAGPSGTSTGVWIARSAATKPVSVASESVRCLAWRHGRTKPSRWPLTWSIC